MNIDAIEAEVARMKTALALAKKYAELRQKAMTRMYLGEAEMALSNMEKAYKAEKPGFISRIIGGLI